MHSRQLSLFQRDSSPFLRAVPPKISIVVPPTDIGYNDHIWKCIDLISFDPQIPLFFTDVSLLLVLAGWQLCYTTQEELLGKPHCVLHL